MKFYLILPLFIIFFYIALTAAAFSRQNTDDKKELQIIPKAGPSYLRDNHFRKTVVEGLYASLDKWSYSGFFKGEKNLNIFYRVYGKARPNSKPLIIVPGFVEFSLKYMELSDDLIKNSFSPIYILDHRNQGASDRILKDKQKIYVENFLFYSKDLKTFIDQIVKAQNPHKKPSLIAHSMGSLISLFYFLDDPHIIQSAVFSSPMLRINIPKYIQKLGLILYPLFSFKETFKIKTRPLNKKFKPKNKLTHDEIRYEFNKFLEQKHDFYLKKITLKWLKEAIEKSRLIHKKSDKINLPVLILQSSMDTVVDNTSMDLFCKKNQKCSLIRIQEAKHEIFMEKDKVRNLALRHTLDFLNKNYQKK